MHDCDVQDCIKLSGLKLSFIDIIKYITVPSSLFLCASISGVSRIN